jgi:hypothetical protein
MRRLRSYRWMIVFLLWLGFVPPTVAAGQRVAIQDIEVNAPARSVDILVLTPFSAALVAELKEPPPGRAWLVISLESKSGLTRTLTVVDVTVHQGLNAVTLKLDSAIDVEWLNDATHVITVTYLRSPSLPRAIWPAPASATGGKSGSLFAAVPTVQAADVSFSGKITAVDAAKPKYSFEAKVKKDWNLGGNRGALGFNAEVYADDETNADPDRITVGSTYRRILDSRPHGSILHVQPIAGEFGRKTPRTKGLLTTAAVEHVLLPTTGPGHAQAAILVYGGVELGSNFANAISKDGSGTVARVRVGANPYAVFKLPHGPFKVFKASGQWDARFLGNEEIDPGRLDAAKLPTLTRRARQFLKIDFDIAVNDFVSLTVQHRQGYLPPTYKKVSPTLVLSLTFKGKWV